MTFKHMVLGAVSAAGILLSVSTIAPATFPMATQAQADTSISVNFSFGTFYDRLEPYGNWVSYQDQYVFIPQHISHGWRPYTLGHWSYTQRYGWLWVSNERFGWATYHYGRWGYSRDIGWYWVPGHRWAPAWVAWSRGQHEIAWAPLPPRRGGDIDINITIGDVPDYYWQAVPTSAFLSINLSDRIIRDRNEVRTIIQQSPPQTVRIENNIVVNNVIQVNEIEKATNTKVTALAEKPVSNPDAVGKTDANTITIFNPEVKVDETAKPKKALQVEQVVTDRKAQGIQPADVSADQPVVSGKTLDKNSQSTTTTAQPGAKADVPADGKTTTEVPVVKPDQKAVEPMKPAANGSAKVDTQDKVDVKKGKEEAPPIVTPPAQADAPVVKQAPAASTPAAKVPAVKTPEVDEPVVEPSAKTKRDKSQEKSVVTPPEDTAKSTPDVPVTKQKSGDAPVKQDTEKNDQAKQNGQQPKDQKMNAKKPKGTQDNTECDPGTENCPPAE